MRSPLRTVFSKEVIDNFRDRRSLLSSLLFGPLFGPLLFALMMSFALERSISETDEPLRIPVMGIEHAPNLGEFLRQSNADLESGPADLYEARDWVKTGKADLVLIIGDDFADSFRDGRPAVLTLVADNANNNATKNIRRARQMLQGYGRKIGLLRLQARGISPRVVTPLVIEEDDVSTPTGRSILLLGMVTYFIIFSMLFGGLYLAIDTTAGERERGSLEPLLALPVPRHQLILGKIFATVLFMTASLLITLVAFSFSLRLVPLEELGMATNFGPGVIARVFLLMLPFALLGAGLMTCVASFTRSYKEAQTYLTVVLLVPTLPILFAGLYSLRPSLALMLVPSLSQHLIITDLLKAEPLDPLYALLSFASTLVVGLALVALAARLYRREGILG